MRAMYLAAGNSELIRASAEQIRKRAPSRYVKVEPDGQNRCIVTTRGSWSRHFLASVALLEEPMEILGPPEMTNVASDLANRLAAAADANRLEVSRPRGA